MKMANEQSGIKFFVIYTILLGVAAADNADDSNPLLELAQSLLQESVKGQNGFAGGLAALGGLAQGFMQNDNVKQLLTNGKSMSGAADVLSGIGATLSAAMQGQNSDKVDPNILGTMIDVFSSLTKSSDNNNVDENNNDNEDVGQRRSKRQQEQDSGVDWDSMAGFAGNLISSFAASSGSDKDQTGGGSRMEAMLSLLSVFMNSVGGQHNSHSSKNIPHHDHPSFLPPFLENLHEYWDHFKDSEFGQTIWKESGLPQLLASGDFFESLENNSFRRKWIKSSSSFVADWVKYFGDPSVQSGYLQTMKMLVNGFLQSQGFPKQSLLDFNKPADSFSELINTIMKRHFNLKIQSANYVKPAVLYVQEIFKGKNRSKLDVSHLSKDDIERNLSETLEDEVIEPLVRLNRAYKYIVKNPKCDKYVLCVLNHERDDSNVKIGLKPMFNKVGSFISAWFISNKTNTPLFEFYSLIATEYTCSKYNRNCDDFIEEDIRATTEYYHTEL